MKLIDTLREKHNDSIFRMYDDTWYHMLQIYSDNVDVISFQDESTPQVEKITIEWVEFLQFAELEQDQKIIDKVKSYTHPFIVSLAKEELVSIPKEIING